MPDTIAEGEMQKPKFHDRGLDVGDDISLPMPRTPFLFLHRQTGGLAPEPIRPSCTHIQMADGMHA